MWNLMLSGMYNPPKIHKIATEEWGLRNRMSKPVSRSSIYSLFANSFYCGWFEYPRGSGNWYQGNHTPMITRSEYDRVQILLGSKGKPRIKKYDFAFTGLIRCSECGAMITAEEKNQIICSKCKHKFSSNNKRSCPKCQTLIEDMKNPTIRHYVYYHCTKRKDPNCTQKTVEAKVLKSQINQYLKEIHISETFKDWAINYLREEGNKEIRSRENIVSSQRKAYDDCLRKIDNLFELKISPMNADGDMLSDEEYAKRKSALIGEKTRLQEILNDVDRGVERWLEAGEKTFEFARNAHSWFAKGTDKEKAIILQALGSNLILRDRKLVVELKKPLLAIKHVAERVPQVRSMFEPSKFGLNKGDLGDFYSQNPVVRRGMNKVRTLYIYDTLSFTGVTSNWEFPSFEA